MPDDEVLEELRSAVESGDTRRVRAARRSVWQRAQAGDAASRAQVLHDVAALLPDASVVPASLIAVLCGGIVETGVDAGDTAALVVERFRVAIARSRQFLAAWNDFDAPLPAIDLSQEGGLNDRLQTVLGDEWLDLVNSWLSVEDLGLALNTFLSKSEPLRASLQADASLKAAVAGLGNDARSAPPLGLAETTLADNRWAVAERMASLSTLLQSDAA